MNSVIKTDYLGDYTEHVDEAGNTFTSPEGRPVNKEDAQRIREGETGLTSNTLLNPWYRAGFRLNKFAATVGTNKPAVLQLLKRVGVGNQVISKRSSNV